MKISYRLPFLALPLLAALASTARADDFEYHGYMRSGIGASRGGTDQVCFTAPGASAKFRLGNECETYLEAKFIKTTSLGKDAAAPAFKTHLLFAAVAGARHDWESTDLAPAPAGQELTLSLREAFVEGKGVLGETSPWAGKRYYRRQDIHILDYYIINNSGPGAGVENIGLGFGKLHLALTRNSPKGVDTPTQNNTDVRLSDVELGTAGKLQVVAIYGAAGKRGHESGVEKWEPTNGLQLSLVHTIDVLGGFNRVTLQRGSGLFGGVSNANFVAVSTIDLRGADGGQAVAKGDNDTLDDRKKSSTLRIAEELVSEFGKELSNAFVLVYSSTTPGEVKNLAGDKIPNKNELLVGVRPVYHLNDTAGVALEAGLVTVKNAFLVGTDYKDSSLTKITLAPQLTGAGFWARPQLRLFATYATWNDESKGAVGKPIYATDTKGFTTGAQIEAWW